MITKDKVTVFFFMSGHFRSFLITEKKEQTDIRSVLRYSIKNKQQGKQNISQHKTYFMNSSLSDLFLNRTKKTSLQDFHFEEML